MNPSRKLPPHAEFNAPARAGGCRVAGSGRNGAESQLASRHHAQKNRRNGLRHQTGAVPEGAPTTIVTAGEVARNCFPQ